MRKRFAVMLSLMLISVAAARSPARANVVESAAATVVCSPSHGSLSVTANNLTPADSYSINYYFPLEPVGGGTATAISGFAPVSPDSNGNLNATIPLSGAPSGDWDVTGTLMLENHTTGTFAFCQQPAPGTPNECNITVNGVTPPSAATLNCPASPPPACSAGISISGSMEGNLPVKSGDTLKAGFDFTIPGSHPADTVSISNASVTLPVQCPNGTSTTLVVPIPNQSITVPANNSNWFPSGDQNSPLVYQGSITVGSICGGATGHAPQGATFKASLTATTKNSVHFRFHYSDNTSGSWSSTQSYCQ